jgi:hypothetical protein
MSDAPAHNSPFNSPLETGLRSVAILAEACPDEFDLQRLLYFDYLVVHSSDADGPASLHPNTPLRNGELLVRRGVIERGLLLYMSRNLIERNARAGGIYYAASEAAGPFLDCLHSAYSRELRLRATWAIDTFGVLDDDELKSYFDARFERWTREFQAVQQPPELLL